jgi:hypothetical protein
MLKDLYQEIFYGRLTNKEDEDRSISNSASTLHTQRYSLAGKTKASYYSILSLYVTNPLSSRQLRLGEGPHISPVF